jgi:serine/threonine protein kinase
VLRKRFEQEFRAANTLDHTNIVRALDFGQEGNTPYLVMEFVDGESLGQRIEREGRLPEVEAVRIIGQVAQGLHKAHKLGMIHRDVKPDNILLAAADGQAKLTDLGLVKELDTDTNLTRTGRGLGTPHFMAPEQFRDAKNADQRCDIYSLGATLYMAVTGQMPFRASNPLDAWMKKVHNELVPSRDLVPSLSERIDWAIRRAMSADPAQRPANCREFVEDLTGKSTRKTFVPLPEGQPQDWWYLYYKDEEGILHTVKGSLYHIRLSLKEGRLGDALHIRASQSKEGPFEPLQSYPEYRDLVIKPGTLPLRRSGVRPAVPGRENNSAATGRDTSVAQGSGAQFSPPEPAARPAALPLELPALAKANDMDWWTWLWMLAVAAVTCLAVMLFLKYR